MDKQTDERTDNDGMVTVAEQSVPRAEPASKQPDQNPRPNPTTTQPRKSRNRDSCVVPTDQLPTILPIKRRKRRPTRLLNDDIYIYNLDNSPPTMPMPQTWWQEIKKKSDRTLTDNRPKDHFCTECGKKYN